MKTLIQKQMYAQSTLWVRVNLEQAEKWAAFAHSTIQENAFFSSPKEAAKEGKLAATIMLKKAPLVQSMRQEILLHQGVIKEIDSQMRWLFYAKA